VPGAADTILYTLEAFGFAWDGPVLHQSQRTAAYAAALARLSELDLTYACGCSRRQMATAAAAVGPEGPIYPGTCRRRPTARNIHPASSTSSSVPVTAPREAIRLRVETPPLSFYDRVQGWIVQDLMTEVGDFVLRRADGLHAYQLAVVVDDAFQGITDIVRGADLTRSTPRQMLLQRLLGLPTPVYAHLPLALDSLGRKLSKSDAATPVDPRDPLPALLQAWAFLGQPPLRARLATPAEFWAQALDRWDLARVPSHAHSRVV
jgi:glutamyl-Q tRNA(Asp) synthetase